MRTIFGTLGVVALFLAVIVGGYAAFVNKQSTGYGIAGGMEATGEATNQQPGQAVGVGQAVNAGDVTWTITDAGQETELHSYTFPPKTVPGNYVSMEFTVENVSDKPVTLTGDTITLFDAEGNQYQPEADRNSTFVEPDLNILFNDRSRLEPGATKEGRVNVGVLLDSSGFTALLGDTDPTVSEGRYVDLGF